MLNVDVTTPYMFQRRRLRQRYLVGEGQDKDANRDALDKVCGDRSFTCPTKELTDIFSGRDIHTYFYYLSYRASTEVWPDWMGVIHGADIQVSVKCSRTRRNATMERRST